MLCSFGLGVVCGIYEHIMSCGDGGVWSLSLFEFVVVNFYFVIGCLI